MTARIVVLGSLNMDLVVRAARFPAPGETLVGHGFATYPGGKGANQAVTSARLCGPPPGTVAMIGRVGADAYGRELLAMLEREGIDGSCVGLESALPTGVAAITVRDSGENQIVVAPGANASLTARIVEAARAPIVSASLLVAQLEVPVEAVAAGLRLARRAGVRTLLNAAPACALARELLADVDVLVVNAGEAAVLAGGDARPEVLAAALLARGPRAVALTLGAEGALWHDPGGSLRCPTPPVEARDTTGAGDAFVGALAEALASGQGAAQALRRACAAGALAVTQAGAIPSLPTAGELGILLSRYPPGP